MMKKSPLIYLLSFLLMNTLLAESKTTENFSDEKNMQKDIDKLCYCLGGMFWTEQLEEAEVLLNTDQVIAGIRAAEKNKYVNQFKNREEFQSALTTVTKKNNEKKARENLAAAETYLAKISEEPDSIEIEPEKLYYKLLKTGMGHRLSYENMLPCLFSVRTVKNEEEKVIFSTEESMTIHMPSVIPGLQKGMEGMCVGEKRRLYIHPNLGYGPYGRMTSSNDLLIIDMEITGDGQT